MTKTIITALVAVTASTAMAAGSLARSGEGSSAIGSGLLGSSRTTVVSLVEYGSSVVAGVSAAGAGVATASGQTSVYVIQNPAEASSTAFEASKAGAKWVVTSTGKVLNLIGDGVSAVIEDPSAASSTAGRASRKAVRVTIDASGNVLSASGDFLKDKYGQDTRLALTGSGEIYEVTAGSVVLAVTGTSAVSTQVGKDSLAVSKIPVNSAREMLSAVSEMPANSFNTSKQSGSLNDE